MEPTAGQHRPPIAGLIAGRYEVLGVLGLGGMGEVRAGRDQRLGRDVAIKLLRPDMAEHPAIRQRFRDEARSAARLVHPHVVAVFDTGEESGVPFLVMERLSGKTLVDEIAGGPLDCEVVRQVGLQMLDALDAAHSAGLVHRDVKPGNVMAASAGTWKLGDFGVAKSIEATEHNLTVSGLVVGTPAYLAPERLDGAAASVASDLYALGVVLYEALTGRRPFEADAPQDAPLSLDPRALGELRPQVPPALGAAVMRAIERDPARRFPTASAMAAALRAAEHPVSAPHTVVLPGEAATPTLVESPALAATPVAQSEPPPALGQLPGPSRRPSPAAGRGAWAIAALRRVVVSIARPRRPPAAPPTARSTPGPPAGSVPPSVDAAFQHLEQLLRQ
ncbi:MAG: serine/threonine-protein kinase [Actinomycetota bacterium]